jgi:hypothetical protein
MAESFVIWGADVLVSRHLLKRTGEALYGPRWQSDLARDLNVTDRTVRRWVEETSNAPDKVYVDLLRLCEGRLLGLDRLIKARQRAMAA